MPSQYAAAIPPPEASTCAASTTCGCQRPLPQRPRPGRRQQPGRPCRRAPARSNAPSTASASGPATARSKKSSWRCSTRAAFFDVSTGINTSRLYPTSRLVSHVTGMQVQRNKAIVGQNAFAHEAGIHQDGMLKDASTYEIMRPEDVGLSRSRAGAGQAQRPARPARARPRAGLPPRRAELQPRVRGVQGAGRQEEGDLRRRHRGAGAERRRLRRPAPGPSSSSPPRRSSGGTARGAGVPGAQDGRSVERSASGDGPVDAVFKTIEPRPASRWCCATSRCTRLRGRGRPGRGAGVRGVQSAAAIGARA